MVQRRYPKSASEAEHAPTITSRPTKGTFGGLLARKPPVVGPLVLPHAHADPRSRLARGSVRGPPVTHPWRLPAIGVERREPSRRARIAKFTCIAHCARQQPVWASACPPGVNLATPRRLRAVSARCESGSAAGTTGALTRGPAACERGGPCGSPLAWPVHRVACCVGAAPFCRLFSPPPWALARASGRRPSSSTASCRSARPTLPGYFAP